MTNTPNPVMSFGRGNHKSITLFVMIPLIGNECSMRTQCSILLNKDPSLNKLPNIPTAFSLAVSHSDPYTHNTLPTHP